MSSTAATNPEATARRLLLAGAVTNALLALGKITAAILGNSNALLADGVESIVDVFSSTLIWGAMLYAGRPPDAEHPYGHGKVESLAAVAGAVFLIGAGLSVAWHSIHILLEIQSGDPPPMPKPWTLLVLLAVIAVKETFFRLLIKAGRQAGSSSVRAEAWHHRSDAITSIAAFLGISLALLGGPGWESADSWAALLSCAVILFNGARLFRKSVGEVIDEQPSQAFAQDLERLSCEVDGVTSAEKCRVRKSGLNLIVDLHIRVPGEISVRDGHRISHEVKDLLIRSNQKISDITVHIEPNE